MQEVMRDDYVMSMIDVPCGDVRNWMFDSWETDSLKLCIQLGIVRAVVDVNKQRFEHHSNEEIPHLGWGKMPSAVTHSWRKTSIC
jgi:hypothetical protein